MVFRLCCWLCLWCSNCCALDVQCNCFSAFWKRQLHCLFLLYFCTVLNNEIWLKWGRHKAQSWIRFEFRSRNGLSQSTSADVNQEVLETIPDLCFWFRSTPISARREVQKWKEHLLSKSHTLDSEHCPPKHEKKTYKPKFSSSYKMLLGFFAHTQRQDPHRGVTFDSTGSDPPDGGREGGGNVEGWWVGGVKRRPGTISSSSLHTPPLLAPSSQSLVRVHRNQRHHSVAGGPRLHGPLHKVSAFHLI